MTPFQKSNKIQYSGLSYREVKFKLQFWPEK